ncbi:unnamed protein product, partial [marine sediment metagenome]
CILFFLWNNKPQWLVLLIIFSWDEYSLYFMDIMNWLFFIGLFSFTPIGIILMAFGYEKRDDPLNILKKRYAKGEITKEEFEQMKSDLVK